MVVRHIIETMCLGKVQKWSKRIEDFMLFVQVKAAFEYFKRTHDNCTLAFVSIFTHFVKNILRACMCFSDQWHSANVPLWSQL